MLEISLESIKNHKCIGHTSTGLSWYYNLVRKSNPTWGYAKVQEIGQLSIIKSNEFLLVKDVPKVLRAQISINTSIENGKGRLLLTEESSNIVSNSLICSTLDTVCFSRDYSSRDVRISTFGNLTTKDRILDLASQGFYYNDMNKLITCYNCGLILDNWTKAYEHHYQLSPDCELLEHRIKSSTNKLNDSIDFVIGDIDRSLTSSDIERGLYLKFGINSSSEIKIIKSDYEAHCLVKLASHNHYMISKITTDLNNDPYLFNPRKKTCTFELDWYAHIITNAIDCTDIETTISNRSPGIGMPLLELVTRYTNHESLSDEESYKTRLSCKICMDNEITHVSLPCGHLSYCKYCISSSKPKSCSICREVCVFLRVYF